MTVSCILCSILSLHLFSFSCASAPEDDQQGSAAAASGSQQGTAAGGMGGMKTQGGYMAGIGSTVVLIFALSTGFFLNMTHVAPGLLQVEATHKVATFLVEMIKRVT